MSLRIPANQVQRKGRIGTRGNKAIYGLLLHGGLHIVTDELGSILGAGTHRAVARHLASQHHDDITYDLEKSEQFSIEHFRHLLPDCEELTRQLRAAQGLE